MNYVLVLLLIFVICAALYFTVKKFKKGGGCCGEHETVARKHSSDRNISHYPYTAEVVLGGMTCENCARKVANALNELEDVYATVSYEKKTAVVRCKKSPDEDKIRQAVIHAGYVVMNITEK